jgi:nucleoid-associated protein YgaU
MQNNRALWLAILVLAIASAVMIFFVLPQINSGKDVAGDTAKDAARTVTEVAKSSADQAAQTENKTSNAASGSELLQKMNRLKADAGAASESLRALYANGKVPTDAELAEAKSKLEAALKAIADFKAPDGSDATVGGVVSGMAASAGKALAALNSMPADAAKAADAASQIASLFSDKTGRTSAAASAANATPAVQPAAVAVPAPTFDVLRVEKDGSTVIAGAAPPKTKVEVMDGDASIGSAVAGAGGDFAIVLDKPLPAGDHSLALKATTPDGKSVISDESATVSVPATKDGKLLAMVTKAGQASRILTKPEEKPKVADAQQASTAASKVADAGTSPANVLPPLPDASKALTAAPPPVPGNANIPAANSAAANLPAAAPSDAQPKAEAAAIRIDAVEIEGDKIFVAGTTRPQIMVQVFADDKLIEATKSSESGHFEAENTMPLSTGNHIIRADMMDQTGSKVVLRASVPFNRPAGDQVSVVADTGSPATRDNALAQSPAMSQVAQMRDEAAKALILLKGLFADGKTPAKDQLAAARSANEIALKALAGFKPAADAPADVVALATKVGKSASAALKLLQDAGDDPAKVGAAIAAIEAAARDALPDTAKQVPTAAPVAQAGTSPAVTAVADAGKTPATDSPKDPVADAGKTPPVESKPAEANAPAEAPQSIEQAPLKESKDSVIIRKGDTLWQISRRVYGRGVRYTTIYLANEDLINNPNKITPGQVFGVPDKVMQTDEDAEKANRNFSKQR